MAGELPAARTEDNPFLSAWHVEQLTASVRGLSMQIVQLTQLTNKLVMRMSDLIVALDGKVTRTTQELLPMVPAIVLEDPIKR